MVALGACGVGKSALTNMFLKNCFIEENDPTIEDVYHKQVQINERAVLLDILDTAGPEEYSAMRDQYVRAGSAFLIVYAVTDRRSFEEVYHYWLQIMRAKDDGTDDTFCVLLVGNKCDVGMNGEARDRKVTHAEGAAMAHKMSLEAGRAVAFIETSAKYNVNVTSAFAGLALMEMRQRGTVAGAKPAKPSKCVLS